MERGDKRRNPFRFKADVLLTGLLERDRRINVTENYLEWMPGAWEPVYSPAYQWFVRFKYMPMASQLEVEAKCWYDHEMAFWQEEVRYMFDTALINVSAVGAFTCALERVEDVRKFMQIRVMGQFVRHDLFSQSEADEIYFEQEEKVNVFGMKCVSRNRRMRTSYVMPK